MNLKNTEKRYGAITKFFHWSVALLILGQFVLGFTMGSIAHDSNDTVWGYNRMDWFQMHQSFGVLMILLVFGRIAWRRYSTLPEWAPGLSQGERTYAHYVERILYWLMVLAPLTGLLCTMAKVGSVNVFGLTIPGVLPQNESLAMGFGLGHAITRMSLILVVFLHVGLVLKHQLFNKDRLLNRMLPFTSDSTD